jgi:hypothetical protein
MPLHLGMGSTNFWLELLNVQRPMKPKVVKPKQTLMNCQHKNIIDLKLMNDSIY